MRIKVTFDIDIEDDHTDEDIEEWLRFELHDNGQMRLDNPLSTESVNPVFGSFEWDIR